MQRLEESSARAASAQRRPGQDGPATTRPEPARLILRRDGDGAPLFSATFILSRPPDPSERLSPLIERAVLAVDLEAQQGTEGTAAGVTGGHGQHGRPVRRTTLELRRDRDDGQAEVLASTTVTGPFAHGALEATLEPPAATELLEGVLGGTAPLRLVARMELAPPAAPALGVRVDLGEIWTSLDHASDETRTFYRADLANYLALWMSWGIVVTEDSARGEEGDDAVLAAVLRAAGFFLWATDDEDSLMGVGYRLSPTSPGPQQVTVSAPSPATGDVEVVVADATLGDLVAPAIVADPQRFVHLVGVSGGRLDAVLPVRFTPRTRSRATWDPPQVVVGDRMVPVSTLLRPRPPTAAPLLAHHVTLSPGMADVVGVGMVEASVGDTPDRRPGPVVDDPDAPMWRDRWDSARGWYAPEFELVTPSPTDDADTSPFRFELETSGHTADVTLGLTATITVTLQSRRSAATEAASQDAPGSTMRPVALDGLTVQLAVPFRDQGGTTRVEQVTADDVTTSGPLGEDGSRIVATFRLIDAWARLAYGSLSTPAFQSQPASVVVSASFEGWRARRRPSQVLGGQKRWALTSGERARDPRALRPFSPALVDTSLMSATVRPAWQVRPELVASLERAEYEWARFTTTRSVPAFVSCATHGAHYRERREGLWRAVGCRPALQLGATEHRTYEPMDVESAAGMARVYRSLQAPGRFLVVPTSYAVGRYEPDEDERAYRPTLLLHSTIDVDVPSNIRCVLAASLQPVLPRFVRAAIRRELVETAAVDPRLEYPGDAGIDWDVRWAAPTEVACVATPDGFDVISSTDVAGFLTLKGMLERTGLRGSATAQLPGGLRVSTSLELSLGSVTGPFEAGPLHVSTQPGAVEVENRCGQRVVLQGLAVDGRRVVDADAMLGPGATAQIEVDVGDGHVDPVYQADAAMERLEEVRAYIEDLELGVVFLATSDPSESGLTALEVETTFLDHKDPENLRLTADHREAERTYTLPLTAFVADPVLEFTVVAVGPDGSREPGPVVTWPVRTRGALIPIGPPD